MNLIPPSGRTPRGRILIVDDHPVARWGMRHLIQATTDLEVAGEAESAQEALVLILRLRPNLVLMDLTMPDKSGLDFIREARELYPSLPVLMLSMHDENVFAERVLRAGGRGYIMKSSTGDELLKAMRCVLAGKVYLSESMSSSLLDAITHPPVDNSQAGPSSLSNREFEVFQLIGQGLSTREISKRLNLSAKTVSTHRDHIREKLRLRQGPELTKEAVRWAATQQLV